MSAIYLHLSLRMKNNDPDYWEVFCPFKKSKSMRLFMHLLLIQATVRICLSPLDPYTVMSIRICFWTFLSNKSRHFSYRHESVNKSDFDVEYEETETQFDFQKALFN